MMTSPVQIFVVSYIGLEGGRALIGAAKTQEDAVIMINVHFVENMDHESFEVLVDDESAQVGTEDGVMTTFYPIVENGESPDDPEECYQVQQTWLY
jgi:hypothetical protein